MNELRLQYHRDTGIRIQDRFTALDPEMEEYVEWLENKLTPPRAVSVKEMMRRLRKTLLET